MSPWILRGFAVILCGIAIFQLMAAATLASYVDLSLSQLFDLWIQGFSPTETYLGVTIRAVGQMVAAMMTFAVALFMLVTSFHLRFLSVIAKDYARLRDAAQQ